MIRFLEFSSLYDLMEAFPTEESCIAYLERITWNGTPVSPFEPDSKVYKCKSGQYKCADSNKYFTIRTGSIFQESKMPLRKWFMAIYIFTTHKKGISSHQLARDLSITQKTAWFVLHRIRLAFGQPSCQEVLNGTIEADETYIGGAEKNKHKQDKSDRPGRSTPKIPVLAMVERGGNVKAVQLDSVKGHALTSPMFKNIEEGSTVITDQFNAYYMLRAKFTHETVNHSKDEFIRGNVHTNTVEGYFSLLKRGIYGIYHSVSPKHLQAYCDEFSFRYNIRKKHEHGKMNACLMNTVKGTLKYRDLIKKAA
jgi:transposase-like protein